jgi:Zn-dependent protease
MIWQLLQGDYEGFVFVGIVLVVAISLHEFGHALAADIQGDHTARLAGRLTLNPLRHLDPVGTLAVVLVGFGWGKPVPFSPPALRNRRLGPAIVALAGPSMNLLLAIGAAIALGLLDVDPLLRSGRFLLLFLSLNVLLALFNLLPFPPLDGSRILSVFLPPDRQNVLFFLDRWGVLILMALVFLGVISWVLRPAVAALSSLLLSMAQAI